jgi:molecular chaperone DnaK
MKFVEGKTVGIDLGTSYSAIAMLDEDGEATILENAQGRLITPSIVILGDEGLVLVGPSQERVAEEPPDSVISAIKRQMGDEKFELYHEKRRLTPELISSMILTKLRQDAEQHVKPVTNAVITVPHYFNELKRQATRHAGRIAGLNVVDIINEPTAATLAYAWLQGELGNPELSNTERTVLVYDLGGGTFDVTIVRYTPTQFTVLATDGDTMLGGLDWTERLADHVAEKFEAKFGLDPRTEPMAKKNLLVEAEAAKRELTLWEKSAITTTFRGQTLEMEVSRTTFEDLTTDLLQRTQDTTEFTIDHTGVDPRTLNAVLLVGGSSAMPAVTAMLEKLTGQPPSRELNPQTAVAQGAAIHAAILEAQHGSGSGETAKSLERRLRSVSTTDVNSHSLGVEITDRDDPNVKLNHVMIPRNSRLPVKKLQRFQTTTHAPQSIHVRLLEGEAAEVSSCTFIGDFRLVGLPDDLPKGSPVEIVYAYDERGHIQVSLKEVTGNNQCVVEIAWSHGLDETAIDALTELAAHYRVE